MVMLNLRQDVCKKVFPLHILHALHTLRARTHTCMHVHMHTHTHTHTPILFFILASGSQVNSSGGYLAPARTSQIPGHSKLKAWEN